VQPSRGSSALWMLRSVPFGKYWRSWPFVFSLMPPGRGAPGGGCVGRVRCWLWFCVHGGGSSVFLDDSASAFLGTEQILGTLSTDTPRTALSNGTRS